jgi:hypothetical protein
MKIKDYTITIRNLKSILEDELNDNATHPYKNSIDSFERGVLAGRLELAYNLLQIIKQGENNESI